MALIANFKRSRTFRVTLIIGVILSVSITLFYNNRPQKAYAASRYWVGGAAGDANNWNNADNWSASSGGEGGAGIPTSSDAVTFNNASAVACTLTGAGTAASITSATYAGALSLDTNTLAVSGNFDFDAGTLNLNTGTLTVTGYLDLTGTPTVDAGSSTINMNGSSKAIYGGNKTFYNLNINDSSNVAYRAANDADFAISHNLTVATSKTFTLNLNATVTINKGATLTPDGTIARGGASELIFLDPDASTIPVSGGAINVSTYFKAATQNIIVQGRTYGEDIFIVNETASDYTATLGTANSQTITNGLGCNFKINANGDGDITADATTYNPAVSISNNGGYNTTFGFAGTGAGSETLKAGTGTWTVGSATVSLTGGTLTAGTSNFIFNRASSVYDQKVTSSGNSFYQITSANADAEGLIFLDNVTANTFTYTTPVSPYKTYFQAGTTATFTNFNVSGEAGKVLIFGPYGSSATWYLSVTNKPTVSYVNVSYSDASGGSVIDADNGTNTDSGNNSNWDFDANVTISGNIYTNEAKSGNLGADKTVGLSVNGGDKTTVETTAGGAFSFSAPVSANNTILLFLDGEDERANLITQAIDESTDITSISMYTNKIVLSHQTDGPMTNTLLATADGSGDDDIAYTITGQNVDFFDTFETWIESNKSYTPGGTVEADDFEIKDGATFAPAGNAVTIKGSWQNNATGVFSSSGTVTFAAPTGTKTIDPAGDAFNNLIFDDNSGTAVFQVTTALNAGGTLTLTHGTLDLNTSDPAVAVSGDLSIALGATLEGSSSSNLSVGGDWSNVGTYSDNLGTLVLSGSAGQTVAAGSSDFYDLIVTNAHADGVSFTQSMTVGGTLTDITPSSKLKFLNTGTFTIENIVLNGQDTGTRVNLVSDSTGNQWSLIVGSTQSISNTSVSDSDASGGDQIIANDGTNLNNGNNLNWLFPPSNYYWIGATTSWNSAANWSSSTGGAGGYGIPGNLDTAVFDDGASGDCTLDGDISITGITNTNYAGTLDGSDHNVAISNDLIFESGNLNLGSDSWNVSGNASFVGATLSADSANFVMLGGGKTLTVSDQHLNDVTIKNQTASGHTIAVNGKLNVDGNLYLYADSTADMTFDLEANNPDIVIAGNIDYLGSGSGTEIIKMGSGTWTVSGNIDLRAGTIAAGTSTLLMNGSAKSLYANNQTLHDFTIDNALSVPYTAAKNSSVAIDGTLSVPSGKELKLYLYSILTLNKGAVLSLGGTISYNGGGAVTVIDATSSTIPASGVISTPVTYKTATEDITVTARTYGSSLYVVNESSNNRTATLGSAAGQTITVGGDFTFQANSSKNLVVSAATYNPNVTTSSNGGYRYYFGFAGTSSGSETLNVGSGAWTIGASDTDFRNGTLNAGTSTFIFNHDFSIYNQKIYSGGNSFYKITNANADTHGTDAGLTFLDSVSANTFTYTTPTGSYTTQFAPGVTATFTNFNVSGQAGKLLVFKPYGSSEAWYLNITNQPTVSYTNPSYSNASGGAQILAYNGTNVDGTNNTNWAFTAPATPTPTITVTSTTEPTQTASSGGDDVGDDPAMQTATPSATGSTSVLKPAISITPTSQIVSGIVSETMPGLIIVKTGAELSGQGAPGATVKVTVNGQTYTTVIGESGTWKLKIDQEPGEYQAKIRIVNLDGSVQEEDVKVRVLAASTAEQIAQNGTRATWALLILLGLLLVAMVVLVRVRKKHQKQ